VGPTLAIYGRFGLTVDKGHLSRSPYYRLDAPKQDLKLIKNIKVDAK